MGILKQNAIKIFGREPETLDEVAHCVIKIIDSHNWGRFGYERIQNVKCVGLSWNITHSETVRNTHSAPEGYQRNWDGKNAIPTSYPGWFGRVWVRYNNNYSGFGSDPFAQTLTHTGTGGSGAYDGPWEKVANYRWKRYGSGKQQQCIFPEPHILSWDFKIFDYDWPLAVAYEFKDYVEEMEEHKKQVILAKLSDAYAPSAPCQPDHKFLWEDEETKFRDEEFIHDCETRKENIIEKAY